MNKLRVISRPTPAGGSWLRRSTDGHRLIPSQTQAADPATEVTGDDNQRLYPLDMSIRYEILGGRSGSEPVSGHGRTTRVGSRNLVFLSDRVLEVNRRIGFALDWPVPLADGVGLRLWAFGTIVDVDSNVVSVAFSRGEFRTCGTSLTGGRPGGFIPAVPVIANLETHSCLR